MINIKGALHDPDQISIPQGQILCLRSIKAVVSKPISSGFDPLILISALSVRGWERGVWPLVGNKVCNVNALGTAIL